MAVMLRTDAPSPSIRAIREAIWSIDPDVPLEVTPLHDVITKTIRPSRVLTGILIAFGGIALVLGLLGVYGVLAYGVTQRTREIGMRIALGAGSGNVVRAVASTAAAFVLPGLIAGAAITLGSGKLIEAQLFGVRARDPLIMAGVATLIALCASAAVMIPALRATRIDPTTALRVE